MCKRTMAERAVNMAGVAYRGMHVMCWGLENVPWGVV